MNRFTILKLIFLTLLLTLLASYIGYADQNLDNLFAKGAYKEVLRYADASLPADSRTTETWLKLGAANEQLGQWEKALACYTISSKKGNDYFSFVGLARVHRQMGRNEKSLECAKCALEKRFGTEALWEFVKTARVLNRQEDELNALKKIIELAPGEYQALVDLGNYYTSERQFEKALTYLKAAYNAKQDVPTSCLLAQAYSATGDQQSALALLKEVAKTKTLTNAVALDLARAYYQANEYENALQTFEPILRNGEAEARDLYWMAACKERIQGMKAASASYCAAARAFGDANSSDAIDCRAKAAVAELNAGKHQAALAHFLFVMKHDPKAQAKPELAIGLADAYCGLKRSGDAISVLEKAIESNRTNVAAYSRLAELYGAAKMPEKAKTVLERMASLNPHDPTVFASLGQYHLETGKIETALGYFSRSNQIRESPSASEGVAVCALKLERKDLAKLAAEQAVKLDDQRWECHRILGQLYLEEGEYRQALGHLELMVKSEPRNIEYWKQLAICYQHANSIAKLTQADQHIIELDKKDVDSRVRLASVALSRGERKVAYFLYKELAALVNGNDRLLRAAYDLSKDFGSKDEALDYLRQYIAVKPQDASAQAELGDLLSASGDKIAAERAYRAAIAANPRVAGCYKKLIQLVKARGIEQEIIDVMQQAVAAGQADGEIYSGLARLCQKSKDYARAVELYEKAVAALPGDASILSALAWCQMQVGDEGSAIVSYEQALMVNPKLLNEYKVLGDLYLKQKKTDAAMKCYRKYLDRTSADWELAKIVGLNSFFGKRYDEAAKYLGMVKGAEARDPNHLLVYGEACFRAGDYDRAIKIYEDLARLDRKTFTCEKVLSILAQSYEKELNELKAGQAYAQYIALETVRDGEAAYKAAFFQEKFQIEISKKIYLANIRTYPDDYRNYYRLGLIYAVNNENLPEAMFVLKKASELRGKEPAIWEQLGRVCRRMKNEENELLAWRTLLSLDGRHGEANKRAGTIQIDRGLTGEGIACLEVANLVMPNDPEILTFLAKGYHKTGRFDNALVLLAKANSLRRDDPEIAVPLAKLYSRSGEKNMAVEVLKGLAGKGETAHLQLYAELLAGCGRNAEAEVVVKTLCARDKGNKDMMLFLARTQRAQDKYQDAVDTYKRISALDDAFAPAHYERAEAYMAMGKSVWAQVFYSRALEKDPKFALAELGLAKVAKTNNNNQDYLAHLENAKKLDPANKQITAELASVKQ